MYYHTLSVFSALLLPAFSVGIPSAPQTLDSDNISTLGLPKTNETLFTFKNTTAILSSDSPPQEPYSLIDGGLDILFTGYRTPHMHCYDLLTMLNLLQNWVSLHPVSSVDALHLRTT